jgi:tripartite-type tricarboxylate transporter receptor subunit TctC
MNSILTAVLAITLACAAGSACSQDKWPTKPVRLVVPSSPGGGTDVFARMLAQALTESTKQQFIVENRPGASGNIGAAAAASAAPDGYTFLVSANAALAINPALQPNASLNVERDLVAVSRGVMAVNALVVNPSTGAKNLAEFIALAKKQPEGIAFGSAGTGTSPYLGVRMIEETGGVKFIHATYKGVAPAYQDLIGGRIQFMYTDVASALPHIKAGKLNVLVVDRKTSLLPGTPTFSDAGWSKFESPTSFSVMAPKGVPQPILQQFAAEVAKALKELAPRLEQQGLVPVLDTPAEFAESLKKERADWAAFIKRNGITADQ